MRTRWYSGTRPTTYHDESGCENEVFATLAQLRAVAADYQVPLATLSIAWLLHQAGVTSVVVGARQPEEVGRNIPAVDLALTPELIIRLADITAPLKEKLGANADMWVSPSRIR
jgi:aryl-alcohol dehydrogenase-like predicted oxidoreductase